MGYVSIPRKPPKIWIGYVLTRHNIFFMLSLSTSPKQKEIDSFKLRCSPLPKDFLALQLQVGLGF